MTALQASGVAGMRAGEIGRRIDVTNRAARETVDQAESLGYGARQPDPSDARGFRWDAQAWSGG
ncbi:hypothetical protein [Rhodococcus gannanensis]|uniref:HTH lacI-type domain-containing protein n=1 Tax=Rhodococcus gannanensis TaxID=1960308 RepID=A0ABW4P0R8_9NOCA